jgi:hypothetical protein
MKKQQSSLIFQLLLLYAALSIILGVGFGIDIAGWWAIPLYNGLSALVKGFFALIQ